MPLEMHHAPPPAAVFDDAFRKYLIDRPGKILFVGHHLTRSEHVRCLVRYISRQGADLEISPFLRISETFFLVIQGSAEEIGCSLIRREDERVSVAFNMLLSSSYLRFLRQLNEDYST